MTATCAAGLTGGTLRRRAAPSAEERSRWQEHRRRLWLRAGSALSMEAGFEHLDRDSYEWRPYGDSEPAAPDAG